MRERLRVFDDARRRLSRRELFDVAWKLGTSAVLAPRVSPRLWAAGFSSDPFMLGVASGDPTPDGIVLWTRLAPDPLTPGGGLPPAPVEVAWEIARDERFRRIERTGTAVARPEFAHSVHVEVAGLEPHREYWYRFHADGASSPIARTRTAPSPGAAVEGLRFAVCGCNNYEHGYFTAFRAIAGEAFDVVVHTGDYIYEDSGDPRPNGVRQHHGGTLFTLDDYRSRYAQYKLDADLRAVHASAPFVVTWDDHEVANDYAGDHDRDDTPPAVFLLRRAAAYQAYCEHMPLRWSTRVGGDVRIYRRLRFGRLLEVNVLDTRQYRSALACGGQDSTDCAAAHEPSRTMMGGEQERWLFKNLCDARAVFTIVAQQVPTFARDAHRANPSRAFMMDKWDGYTAARDRLYAQLVSSRAPNPVILSGDVHLHYASDVKLDYANPHSPTIAAELTNTSITSNGDGADVSRDWPAIQADNPHVKYHSARRGYIACTATPAALRADFRVLDKVTEPGYPTRTDRTVVVEAGRAGVIVDR
jgi:alkaline phosphatase D